MLKQQVLHSRSEGVRLVRLDIYVCMYACIGSEKKNTATKKKEIKNPRCAKKKKVRKSDHGKSDHEHDNRENQVFVRHKGKGGGKCKREQWGGRGNDSICNNQ